MDWKEKLNLFRRFHENNNDLLPLNEKKKYRLKQELYLLSLDIGLSPIEMILYDELYTSNLPFFPQFPVLNYMVDFCDPVKKIIIECDGLAYHNLKKDLIRDSRLIKAGYKVFRLSAKTIMNDNSAIEDEIDEAENCLHENHPDLVFLYEEYFEKTCVGFVESLKDIIYSDINKPKSFFDLKLRSLHKNRIVEFKILPNI